VTDSQLVHSGTLPYAQDFRSLVHKDGDGEPLQQIWMFNLAVGLTRTILCEAGLPATWVVSLTPSAACRLYIWSGANASGDPIVIGGGGSAKFRATSEFVTIQASGGTCIGNVVGLRNTKVTIDPGNVA
jgi:hypothetical protein